MDLQIVGAVCDRPRSLGFNAVGGHRRHRPPLQCLNSTTSGATDYPLLVAVSSGRNRQRDLTRLSESKQVRQAKAVQKLVFAYPFRSVAPFSHPIPSIG